MSIFTVIEDLRRIHNAHGKLTEIVGHLQTFERAVNFNPRDRDAWDLFDMRDDKLTRIIRVLRRNQRTTQQMARAGHSVPNRSRDLNRLFGNWAAVYAENGEGSREVDRAQSEFVNMLFEWVDNLETQRRQQQTSIRAIRRQLEFYRMQKKLFSDLEVLANKVVQYGVTDAHRAQAFAYARQFDEISTLSNSISRHYQAGISSASSWQGAIHMAKREADAWLGWVRNRRNVQRSLQSQRAPR